MLTIGKFDLEIEIAKKEVIQKKKEAWEIATKVLDYKLLAQQMYY